jgi:hypothetical protein
MLGRRRIGEIELLSDPDNGILNARQQASFDAAHAEWKAELAEKLQPLVQR